MKEKAAKKINEIGGNHNHVVRLVRKMKIKSTDVVGRRCMRGNDITVYLNDKDRARHLIARQSKIMDEENE